MKKRIIISIAIVSIIILTGALIYWFNRPLKDTLESVKTDYNSLDLTGYDKLMIVAHPDDDMLWGGSHLINEDFLVVCVTCGGVAKRVEEFKSVMAEVNDAYVMLDYPDKTNGERDDWSEHYENITEDIKNIYGLKNWKEVVTHNPEGEYGHQHHKMTSAIVTGAVDKNKLTYFGKYYSKKELEEKDIKLHYLPDETVSKKKEILKIYESQENTVKKFMHMVPSEELLSYKEWQGKYEKE